MDKSQIGNIRVLLVEDDKYDVIFVREMLEEAGVSPSNIENANRLSHGLERLKSEKFDVLLLDLKLPDSDGIETIRDVLSHEAGMPIVVLTGNADETLGIDAVKVGAQDYLLKGNVDSNLLMRSILYAIERQRLLAELHTQSLTDFLTGLNNRRGFFTLAEQHAKLAKREKKSLILVIIDIDDFKKINDEFGHKTGDQALIATAGILSETFRGSDVMGRIGGDEFAICVVEDNASNTGILTARLLENLEKYNNLKTLPCGLSFSFGVARCVPESFCSLEAMVSEADRSMYERKEQKKNRKL